jgi:hypothetical protein
MVFTHLKIDGNENGIEKINNTTKNFQNKSLNILNLFHDCKPTVI